MAPFCINGNVLAPEDVPSNVPRTAEGTDFILVQSKSTLSPDQKDDLVKAGAEILEFLGNNTYLCRYEPADLQTLREKSYITEVSIYLRELKSTITLKETIDLDTNTEDYEIDCILHEAPGIVARELAPQVAKAAQVGKDELEVSSNKIRLVINQRRLGDLVKLDFVNRIEQVHPDVVVNNLARNTLLTAREGDMDVISSAYTGQGQTICVADTGFDLGTRIDVPTGIVAHPAFKDRLIRVDTPWPGDDGFDANGHGTHVCASICGNGVYKDNDKPEVTIQGTAPLARILVQSLSRPLKSNRNMKSLTVPSDTTMMFEAAYSEGIRIHSNSWAKKWSDDVGQLDYEDQATQIDRFVYGSVPPITAVTSTSPTLMAPHHEDFVVLIAAGNNGDAPSDQARWPSQIGAAAAAKNAITVGAVGSVRPNNTRQFVRAAGARPVTGINETAVFSSRGPTRVTHGSGADGTSIGRIKPDIVAPGVAILSAASRAMNAQALANARKNFGDSGDKDWIFMSGTSMATPLVAGCVALLREALQDLHDNRHPSAALIKALLVNGAINFSGKLGPGFGYDYEQGFGRVIIDSSIAMIRNGTFVDGRGHGGGGDGTDSGDTGRGVDKGEAEGEEEKEGCRGASRFDVPGLIQTGTDAQRRWESGAIEIPADLGRCRLVATLVYPDLAGTHLHNVMNLIVVSGREFRHGNMGRNGGSASDNLNNVEKVLWDNVPGSTFKVVVRVENNWKPRLPASFAVTWDLRAMAKL
ncbi:serine protease AprX [Microdochium nivale]|nr:serine protease AprX [Microdochium nivale]